MRKILKPEEISKIVLDHLILEGKLEKKEALITWNIDNWNFKNSEIIIEQN